MTRAIDRPSRWWGTEEKPTLLRKAWWVIKEAFFALPF